jgi:hypothetical protein
MAVKSKPAAVRVVVDSAILCKSGIFTAKSTENCNPAIT